MDRHSLPVVIIGAGPVGLAAAAHTLASGRTPLVLEAGDTVGAGVMRWAHVRMFSPWKFNIDPAAAAILQRHGWSRPADTEYPTGRDMIERYLRPLADTSELAPCIRLATRVLTVSRYRHDRMKDGIRQNAPFVVRVAGPAGEEDILAGAVIDASGTIESPGPLGASGVPAIGERALSDRIFYGMPDVLGSDRGRYAGRRVLVVGSGHSACNVLLDLVRLSNEVPETRVHWAVRRPTLQQILGGGKKDQLEERGKLGLQVRHLIDEGRLHLVTGFHLDRLTATPGGIVARGGEQSLPPVDEIVAATGFRPDWRILAELRLDLDPTVESPKALAPLIDPNVHSCGTVPPHGAEELKHPDADVFVVGMKSYGRAPTFLMLTGYEQVRSVVRALAGDWEAARRVELVLPETGVCSIDPAPQAASTCCSTAGSEQAARDAVPVAIGRPTSSPGAPHRPVADAVPASQSCC